MISVSKNGRSENGIKEECPLFRHYHFSFLNISILEEYRISAASTSIIDAQQRQSQRADAMRKYLHIDLRDQSVREEEFSGEQVARAGRYFIAKSLVEMDIGPVDPLGPENPLIFSAGPFAGSSWSNANRNCICISQFHVINWQDYLIEWRRLCWTWW